MRNAKSNRLLVLSRLVGISGVFACMMAAIVYLLLQITGVAGVYNPTSLYIIAVLAVVFVAIAFTLRAVSNRAAKAEQNELELSEVVEDAVEEVLETDADLVDSDSDELDEIVEEIEGVEETIEEAPSKGILQLTPEKKEQIVKTVKKNAPVVLAIAATAAVSIALSNSAKRRERDRVRRSILDLLY